MIWPLTIRKNIFLYFFTKLKILSWLRDLLRSTELMFFRLQRYLTLHWPPNKGPVLSYRSMFTQSSQWFCSKNVCTHTLTWPIVLCCCVAVANRLGFARQKHSNFPRYMRGNLSVKHYEGYYFFRVLDAIPGDFSSLCLLCISNFQSRNSK